MLLVDTPPPVTNVIYACCDGHYFDKFAEAFVNSACMHGHYTEVHVVNPTKDTDKLSTKLMENWPGQLLISSQTLAVPYDEEKKRTIYASYRFHNVVNRISDIRGYLVLDIDCVIRRPIDFPDTAVGIYFRENNGTDWESMGMRVAAGAVYYGPGSQYFANCVSKKIESYDALWFVDQRALWDVSEQFKYATNITDLSKIPGFMDWEFNEDSYIWTGKGPRKYENKKYVAEVEKYKHA